MKKYYWTAGSNDKSFVDSSSKLFYTKEDAYEDMREAALSKMKWNTEWSDFAEYCDNGESGMIDYQVEFSRDKIVHKSYSGEYTYTIQEYKDGKESNSESVYIAIITSNSDGNVVVTTKPFYTSKKAEEYLMQQYKEIKGTEEFFIDKLSETGTDGCTDFFMETEDMYYWCSGEIQKTEVERL